MLPKEDISLHCRELNRCNQRGGRLLSLVDLYKAKTMHLELAAFLLYKVSRGDSFVTGAVPGGAGKTTVMCALANAIPSGIPIRHAARINEIIDGERAHASCYICHEMSEGGYFGYLWGEELRAFFKLKKYGHILASNLHADTLEQARLKITKQNKVTEESFNAVNIYVFITQGITREIKSAWYSPGNGREHAPVYVAGKFNAGSFIGKKEHAMYMEFIRECAENNVVTLEDFRAELLEFRE